MNTTPAPAFTKEASTRCLPHPQLPTYMPNVFIAVLEKHGLKYMGSGWQAPRVEGQLTLFVGSLWDGEDLEESLRFLDIVFINYDDLATEPFTPVQLEFGMEAVKDTIATLEVLLPRLHATYR